MGEQGKHTPLPWEAGRMVNEDGSVMTKEELRRYLCEAIDNGNDDGFFFISQGDRMPDICHTGNGPTSRENAMFIVRACNSHYELLAACKAVVMMLDCDDRNPCLEEIIERANTMVRAALAKARSEAAHD